MVGRVNGINMSTLEKILDAIIQEIPSRYGAFFLVDRKNRIIRLQTHIVSQKGEEFCGEMIREALDNRQPLIASDRQKGIHDNIVCFPLLDKGKPIGGIYLKRESSGGVYSTRDLEILAAFARPVQVVLKRNANRESLTQPAGHNSSCLVGKGPDFFRILHFIDRVKNNDAPVFISGESGTGKEVVARTIHNSGARKKRKFIAINCGAIPDHLLESELFGYARGAFTGAVKEKPGLIEEADQGTFFMDEIGDLSPPLQAKLLRAVQEKEIRRVGETRMRSIDVRFISATNKDIDEEVEEGRFREDLYYRLNIVSVHIPPLRERKEDILILVNHFVDRYCCELNRARIHFSPGAIQLLLGYSWPGNVRELQNEIQRCLILCWDRDLIREEYLSGKIRQKREGTEGQVHDYFRAKAEFEKKFLHEALARSDYNRTRTAEEIGLSRQGLFKLMKKHGILSGQKTERIGNFGECYE
jgi:transcriptional regulator with PAS, ATPase and Fis domain